VKSYRICLLPGDGIGPEVIAAAQQILEVLPINFTWVTGEIGFDAYQHFGTPLPDETLDLVSKADATLFGAVTTPPDIPNYRSPVLRLRQELDLYANLRPCRSFPHPSSRPGINLVLVRENTEDLYAGIERLEAGGERAVAEMVITRSASERITRSAFGLARQMSYDRVTIVHKANVLRETSGLFRRVALQVAKQFPDIQTTEMLVDTCAMELIRQPEQFQVIVTTNMFGDILSDEASMLVGGLGLAASANIGEQTAVFEPVHGSAPSLAGLDRANPLAAILSAGLMLRHLGEEEEAVRVEEAVERVISDQAVTADLGGNLGTQAAARAIIQRL
jgi:homoisocitrate dehydrogenase